MSNLVVMHLVFRVTIIVLFIAGPEAALNLHQSSLRSSPLEIFFGFWKRAKSFISRLVIS